MKSIENKSRAQKREQIFEAEDNGNYACVLQLCKPYLEEYPRDKVVWIVYGEILSKFSLYDEAEFAFDKAIKSKSNAVRFSAWIGRGFMNQRRGNLTQAEKCFQKAAEIHPDEVDAYVFWGVCAFQRGDLKTAEEILRRAIASNGNTRDEAYFNLGSVLMVQERYFEAVACYKEAINIDPNYEIAKARLKDIKLAMKNQKPN